MKPNFTVGTREDKKGKSWESSWNEFLVFLGRILLPLRITTRSDIYWAPTMYQALVQGFYIYWLMKSLQAYEAITTNSPQITDGKTESHQGWEIAQCNELNIKIFKVWSRELLGYPQGQNYFHKGTNKLIYLPFSISFLHKYIYNQLNEEADMRIHPRTQVRNLIFLSAILHIKLISKSHRFNHTKWLVFLPKSFFTSITFLLWSPLLGCPSSCSSPSSLWLILEGSVHGQVFQEAFQSPLPSTLQSWDFLIVSWHSTPHCFITVNFNYLCASSQHHLH